VVSVPAREDLGKATATTPVNGYLNSGYEITIIDEYSGDMVPLDEAHAKRLIEVLEQRMKTEYVNLMISRPSRSGK